jgi:putative membrane protein
MAVNNGGEKTEAFLGTQGYFWDTQTDMFACPVASIAAFILLGRWHDRSLEKLKEQNNNIFSKGLH